MEIVPAEKVNELRAHLSSVVARADGDKVPDGYASGLDEDNEYISDWSTYLADKVLAALADGGLTAERIVSLINNRKLST